MSSIVKKATWICVEDRRVLMARSIGIVPFYTPGGKIEPGETLLEALVREIYEEFGVTLLRDSAQHSFTVTGPMRENQSDRLVELNCFRADYKGRLAPSSEIDEIAWFSKADGHKTTETGRDFLARLHRDGLID